MDFTGERYVPDAKNNEPHLQQKMFQEHINRYQFAKQFIKGKRVLDLGCGVGYGSDFLAVNGAEEVVGIDISEEAINYAVSHYKRNNLSFQVDDCAKLKLDDNSFDIVVCFELIEHLKNYEDLLRQTVRILKHDGILLISTPRKTERLHSEFHIHEFEVEEFSRLLRNYYKDIRLYFQNNCFASLIIKKDSEIEKINISDILTLAPFDIVSCDAFIAVCSTSSIDIEVGPSLIVNDDNYVTYLEKEQEILKKDREDYQKERKAYVKNHLRVVEEKDTVILQLANRLIDLQRKKEELFNALYQEKTRRIKERERLEKIMRQKDNQIRELERRNSLTEEQNRAQLKKALFKIERQIGM